MKIKYIPWVALICYILALFIPAVIFKTGQWWSGFHMLEFGWLGPLDSKFAWYANIFILIATVKIINKKYKKGLIWSAAAFILGLHTLSYRGFQPSIAAIDIELVVDHYGYAFYLWELSFLLVGLYAWVLYQKVQSKPKTGKL